MFIKKITLLSLSAILTLICTAPALAWVNDNVKKNSDIIMKEMRWPVWDAGTYYCTLYAKILGSSNNFYGGFVSRGEKRPGFFWTYWGDIKGVAAGPQFSGGSNYGAEGAAGNFSGHPDFLRPTGWYRIVIRVYPNKKDPENNFCGWWVKDVEKGIWYHHSTAELVGPGTGLQGNGGFVESLANGDFQRAFERRLGYGREYGGDWYKMDGITTNLPERLKAIENGTVLRYDSKFNNPVNRLKKGEKSKLILTPNQPSKPKLDALVVEDAKAVGYKNQVTISWSVPNTSSPQMGQKIEIFSQPNAKGELLLTDERNTNYVYARTFQTKTAPKSVRLTIIDIFDQTKSVVLPIGKAVDLDPATRPQGETIPGLCYKFYEGSDGDWEKLSQFDNAKLARQGVVSFLDESIRGEANSNYGVVFEGYLKVPTDGLYVLMQGSRDGSRVTLDGKVVVENDGIHGSTPTMYPLALKKGLHKLKVEHFCHAKGRLVMHWEGPGFERRPLVAEDFLCDKPAKLPTFNLNILTPVKDGKTTDNLISFEAKVNLSGHPLTRIQLFADQKEVFSTTKLDGKNVAKMQLILPEGKKKFWARLWYDEMNSVNSANAMELDVVNYVEPNSGWAITDFGNKKFPSGARIKDGNFQFVGEGVYYANRKVKGDFTITGHIAEMGLATKENGIDRAGWIGLEVEPKIKYRSTENFSFFRTAGLGYRSMPNTRDLYGNHYSTWEFGNDDHRWIKITKRGQRLASFTSADGKIWSKTNEQIYAKPRSENPADVESYVGVIYRTVPGKGRSFFYATMNDVNVKLGTPPLPKRPTVQAADIVLNKRIVSVVQSRLGEKKLLYARSATGGILISADYGETWNEANGNLRGNKEAMATRAVAVHGTDAKILLRGGGRMVGGKLKSGLWKSTNSGKSWKLVSDKIDFDGTGPTALLSDTIQFSANMPNVAVAAGETSGVYYSNDTGETWHYAGLKGERVSVISTDDKGDNFLIGTFADSEFAQLKLGKPNVAATDVGSVYLCTTKDLKEGKGITVNKPAFTAPKFGITGVASDGFTNFLSTWGSYHTWLRNGKFLQKRQNMPADTFNIAYVHTNLDLAKVRYNRWKHEKHQWLVGYTAPFSDPKGNQIYKIDEGTKFAWNSIEKTGIKFEGAPGAYVSAGLTCVRQSWIAEDETLFLCNRFGLFKSQDGGKSFKLVCRPR